MKKLMMVIVFTLLTAYAYADEMRFSVPLADSPVLGPADAPVTIIEFLDFQ